MKTAGAEEYITHIIYCDRSEGVRIDQRKCVFNYVGIFQDISPCWKQKNPGYLGFLNFCGPGFSLAREISY